MIYRNKNQYDQVFAIEVMTIEVIETGTIYFKCRTPVKYSYAKNIYSRNLKKHAIGISHFQWFNDATKEMCHVSIIFKTFRIKVLRILNLRRWALASLILHLVAFKNLSRKCWIIHINKYYAVLKYYNNNLHAPN